MQFFKINADITLDSDCFNEIDRLTKIEIDKMQYDSNFNSQPLPPSHMIYRIAKEKVISKLIEDALIFHVAMDFIKSERST
ncbi:MAG: hypothetical protein ACREA8_01455 [Nitrosotalea sp.]